MRRESSVLTETGNRARKVSGTQGKLGKVRTLQFKKKGEMKRLLFNLNDAIVKIVHHVRFVKVLKFFVV